MTSIVYAPEGIAPLGSWIVIVNWSWHPISVQACELGPPEHAAVARIAARTARMRAILAAA
jgi:hypothetical protein